MPAPAELAVYVETGTMRAFACAVDWPGWCRSGKDEDTAVAALLASAPRFKAALEGTRLGFSAPTDRRRVRVVERIRGDATTDFGAPGAGPESDQAPMSDADLRRTRAIIRAAWRAFDDAARMARGKKLATGPRGGGRSVEKIVEHVVDAERGYLGGLGWKARTGGIEALREAVIEGLAASARGEIPARGPRGGMRWKPRFFARRLAWHSLDHAWEIEDRVR